MAQELTYKNKLYTKIHRKGTDKQNFLHSNSKEPNSIAYSFKCITHIQGLNTSFISHNISKSLLRKGANLTFLDKYISTVEKLDRNGSLKENVREKTNMHSTNSQKIYNSSIKTKILRFLHRSYSSLDISNIWKSNLLPSSFATSIVILFTVRKIMYILYWSVKRLCQVYSRLFLF